ncbi:MAG: alpha/beta fold hydrolase BchO [Pseudomonadota bacterium]
MRSAGPVVLDIHRKTGSRLQRIDGLHVRVAGAGPVALLVHGTGSTGHTWEPLLAALDDRFTLVAPDLPGHGESSDPGPGSYSPGAMAHALVGLIDRTGLVPEVVIGHSAGCAVLASALAAGRLRPRTLIALNPAMLPFPGLQGVVFPGAARLLARLPLVADTIAHQGRSPAAVRNLLEGIGSHLDEAGIETYRALFGDPSHIRSVLRMMAEWDLHRIAAQLPKIDLPCLLLGGGQDRAVPQGDLARLAERLPRAERLLLMQQGHLLQEEVPERVAELVLDWCRRQGVLRE